MKTLFLLAALLQSVPDVKQTTDYSCGPSSLSAVLAYYGKPVKEEVLLEEMDVDPETGTALSELIEASENHGVKARLVERTTIEALEEALDRGQLTIILGQAWRGSRLFRRPGPWANEWDSGHYMVVIGHDEENIYFEDPWIKGNRGYISKEEFEDRWHGHSDTDVETQHQAIFFEGEPDTTRRSLRLKSIYIN